MVPVSTHSLGTRRSGTKVRKGRALSAGAALRLSITIPVLPGCVFHTHNFKFKQEEKKAELYRPARRCILHCCSETDIYSGFHNGQLEMS